MKHAMCRNGESGWVLCAMNDPVFRRGIWMRCNEGKDAEHVQHDSPVHTIEMCGGREGDDWYTKLDAANTDLRALEALHQIMSTGAWMVEEWRDRQTVCWACLQDVGLPMLLQDVGEKQLCAKCAEGAR